jgi:hypothetical protein
MEPIYFGLIALTTLIVVALGRAGLRYLWRRPADEARVVVTAVYLTAEGSLLDVRYRITRPGRRLARPDEIYILSGTGEQVGPVAGVTRIGTLAPRSAMRGRGGYLLLRNTPPVARGDRVTVIIGRQRYANLPVI